MTTDVRGLMLTTRIAGAVERYDRAVDDLLEFRPELPETIQSALAFDGQFVGISFFAGWLSSRSKLVKLRSLDLSNLFGIMMSSRHLHLGVCPLSPPRNSFVGT